MFHKILVPLDGSPASEASLPVAIDLARRYEASIELMTVSLMPSVYRVIDASVLNADLASCRAYLESAANRVRAAGVNVTTCVSEGAPAIAKTLVTHAAAIDADLIVMTTHGEGTVERVVLGSVASKVTHHTRIPVLLVHPSPEAP
jgi:nucleotide-binding universal stress UspA family protein